MRSWRSNNSLFAEMEKKIGDKNICLSCGHFGKIQGHTKSGCTDCKTSKGCDFTKYKDKRLEIKNELQIRSKALVDPEFPNEALINEFLIKKDNVKELDLKWRQPNLINFVKFTTKFLGWDEIYAFEKMLPILTRWQIKNHKFVFDKLKRNSISAIKGIIFPKYIKKVRNPKGVPSYEIVWEDKQQYFEHLIPEEQLEEYLENKKDDVESLWSTIEPKYLIDAAYPDLVDDFLEKKGKKGKKPLKRQKKVKNNDEISELTDQLLNTSITEPKVKKTRRPRKTKEPDPVKTIDNFFPKTKVELLIKQSKDELNFSFDLNASKFGDECESDLDLSEIIDNIVMQSPKLPEKLKKLGFTVSLTETNDGRVDSLTEAETKQLNQSCFFETNYDQVDLFEKTFDKSCLLSDSESDSELNNTFDDNYVPLFDRIKNGRLNTVP